MSTRLDARRRSPAAVPAPVHVGLLTGGNDKHYAVGLASALAAHGVQVDFIGSDDLDCAGVRGSERIAFLNLRGDQREDAGVARKVVRILAYYARLLRYAAVGRPRVLHILWNNKFEIVDRTLLMLYYRLMGRRVVMTAHNVNAAKRDGTDGWLNRASLRIQYGLCDAVFVHTDRMARELEELGVGRGKAVVIPYGLNVTIPTTGLTRCEARSRLGVGAGDKTMLFFGQIAPYKGLDVLVAAMPDLLRAGEPVRLIIGGKVKRGWEDHWAQVQQLIAERGLDQRVTRHVRFVPDEEIEQFFEAADVVILPYRDIFQSGVLFLAQSFGVPVIATDVGSMRDDIIEDRTGLVCRPGDAADLGRAIARYFSSDLYRNLDARRHDIRALALERHSWTTVAGMTAAAYAEALGRR